ncbi:acyltransferase-domain-containing protein [Sphaerosporella brunnea]|uniref:Acyltransferase-domain-containing protein n=1 Tax=Sphaerosporella brunnea TaxID=1250544 RepID=A0A5J5EVL2_9PEZI|nr:acyltransferase-domain-containing protein [Sphaerosporella brunnea]
MVDNSRKLDRPPSGEKIGTATKPAGLHPSGAVRYGGFRRFIRMCSCAIWLLSCVLVILATQFIGAPLYFVNRPMYYAWMSRTKQHFGVFVTTLTQWWSPTVVRVTGDKSVRRQLKQTADGSLECQFPERMILIANHQLYSDWLYLWWIAYTAKMHGFIYIILKESLKWLPLVGVGMQFYGFIFMARKWEQDKSRMEHRLSKLAAGREDPMWLLIFPEGTNASSNGRNTSAKFAKKLGVEDLKHQLLPRSTGLRFCLEQMKETVDWVYDCTVAYEGVRRNEFGQDYFTLYSTYFEGRPPKSVNMHWRRFAVKDIPIEDPAEFELWLRERWYEKDNLLEYYMENGRFPEDDEPKDNGHITENIDTRQRHKVCGEERTVSTVGGTNSDGKWEGPVETEVKLARWWDVLDIFTVVFTVFLMVRLVFQMNGIYEKVALGIWM